MKKGFFILLLFAMVFGSLLAGCSPNNGGKGKNETNKAAVNDAKRAEEVVITLWSRDDVFKGDESPGMLTVKEFNEKYKGKIRVDAKFMPQDTYNPSVQAAISSKSLPDIFVLASGMDLQTVQSNQVLAPLNDMVSDAWVKQFGDGSFMEGINVFDGKIYSYPFFGAQLENIFYYNPDVLKKAGLDPGKPPKTWDELRSMARQVTEQGNGDVFGVLWPGADGDEYYTRVVHGLTADVPQQTGGFNYAAGEYNYNSDANKETIQFMLDLKRDGSIMPATFTANNSEARSYFAQGKAAFLFDYRSAMAVIKRDYPDFNFSLATTPTKTGGKQSIGYSLASGKYVVAATTKHPKEVGIFLEDGLASKAFYEKTIYSGVAMSPFDNLNKDESLYGYPQFKPYYELHTNNMRIYPDIVVRNAEMKEVLKNLGGFKQSKITPNFNDLIEAAIISDDKDKKINESLDQYTQKLNQAMATEITNLKASGKAVDMNDLLFPNWDPYKDYVAGDYKNLK